MLTIVNVFLSSIIIYCSNFLLDLCEIISDSIFFICKQFKAIFSRKRNNAPFFLEKVCIDRCITNKYVVTSLKKVQI